jgi:hypothetical protein
MREKLRKWSDVSEREKGWSEIAVGIFCYYGITLVRRFILRVLSCVGYVYGHVSYGWRGVLWFVCGLLIFMLWMDDGYGGYTIACTW